MPVSPLVADLCPVDFDHLERMTFGEAVLEREVLEMFLAQSNRLLDTLTTMPAETSELAHRLKGSARAIGAFNVADRAAALEVAGQGGDAELAALGETIAEARAAIEARLARS